MNPMISSPLDMGVTEPENDFDEKAEVTNITPDGSTDGLEDAIRADDFAAIRKKFLPEQPDLETLAEAEHTWNITQWTQLSKKEHGPIFECGGSPWRVLFFPFGNQPDWASFYLEHGYEDKPPADWYACVQFLLVLWNPNDPTVLVPHTANHRFNADESDWGFTRFTELRKAMSGRWNSEGRHLIEDNAANMTAYVRVVKDPTGVLWHSFINYDSKKETGMVGLKNQGATCYLNSLLQSLYFTNSFRKAVYQLPTEDATNARDNSAYALQRLFYLLQKDPNAISTNELTQSFGWESRQIFEQQDVQELSRILMDRLEAKMKGTEAENALPELFVGSMKTYISCINVPYESSRLEDFWDIQLNVRGNNTLDDSFKDYINTETMDGENKYFAEGHGLQDAKKGVIFEKFPEVLHLQLKRFEYSWQQETMTKIYDRYEFPEVWDAAPYLSADADKSESYIYHLHGVLVHSGDLNAGHYYAFLKPNKDGPFYKFDDDRVTCATKKEAMEENYGGEFSTQTNGYSGQRIPGTRTWSKQRFMSAYMLVYIRETRLDKVLKPITELDIPEHLERKITEERNEHERIVREREEAHLYMQVHVGTEENFNAHQGFDIFPTGGPAHTADSNRAAALPKPHRVLRKMLVSDFNEMIAKSVHQDADLVRAWGLVGRQNGTVRPDMPITWNDMTIEDAISKMQAKSPFRVWIETTTRKPDGTPDWADVSPPKNLRDPKPIVLFLKHFDAEAQTLKGHGHVIISNHQKISEIGPLILERMGWAPGTQLKLHEEIKTNMIDPMNTKSTFLTSELQDGDIICFQKALSEAEIATLTQAGKYTEPRAFYEYLQHKVSITFSDRNAADSEDTQFTLILSKKMAYDQVAAKVGEHLQIDPTHLRFSTVLSSNGKPKAIVKKQVNQRLENIMNPQTYNGFGTSMSQQRQDWLLYEVLEMSLAELETKRNVKVTFLSEGITKEEIVEVLVPKTGTVSDISVALQKKANLSDEFMVNLRLYESSNGRIVKDLAPDSSVLSFNEWVTIYAEQIPDEERNAGDRDNAVLAFHFDKETTKPHGVPFKFVVKPDELFKDTKERLSKRTGIKGKQLEKIKFAVVSRHSTHKPDYLEDDDVLYDKLVSDDDLLGLDHVNKSRNIWNKSDVMMIR